MLEQLDKTDFLPKENGFNTWEEVVRIHQRYIFNLAYHLCNDPYDADDLTQETFLKAFENFSSFRKEASLRTWLSKITLNNYLSKKKKKVKHETIVLEIIPAPDWSNNPERVVIRRELLWCIQHILQHHLSNDYRVVLILRDINQLSYEEVAEVLGVPVTTVKSRLHRARKAYRDHLYKTGCAGMVRDYTCYCEGVREV